MRQANFFDRVDEPTNQEAVDTPLKWHNGGDICLGDVVKCGKHIGVVYWSDYFQDYEISVGTGLTLCSGNMDILEFVRRGENKLCECGDPYPVERSEKMHCQCGRRLLAGRQAAMRSTATRRMRRPQRGRLALSTGKMEVKRRKMI